MNWPYVAFETLYNEPSRNGVYKSKEFHGSGTKIVNMGELFGYEFISNQEMKLLELSESELEKNLLCDGDLLFGRRSLVESGAGKCSIVINPTENIVFESSIIRVRLNKNLANPLFYYYWFKSSVGRAKIWAIVTGTNVKGIKGSDLKNVLVANPSVAIQNRIVEVCKKYDDLIENNRRRIQLLEESARLLYQEWFVHLRFPGHEQVKIVDGVPVGWRNMQLTDVANVNQASLKKGFAETIEYIDISCVSTHSISDTTWYEFIDAPGRARRIVKHCDILWSCVRPNRRSHALVWEPHDRLIASTGFAVISATEVSPLFLYQLLTTNEYVGYLTNRAGGVAYPAVTARVFEESSILVPTKNLVDLYEKQVQDIYAQINILRTQNIKLAQARDLLLPKLMSSELTV